MLAAWPTHSVLMGQRTYCTAQNASLDVGRREAQRSEARGDMHTNCNPVNQATYKTIQVCNSTQRLCATAVAIY